MFRTRGHDRTIEVNGCRIDVERLREDLIEELNIAAYAVSPAIFGEVSEVERASAAEVVEEAIEMGYNLSKYRT